MAAGRLPGGDRDLAPPCQPPSVPRHARGRDRTSYSYGQIIVRSLRAQDRQSPYKLKLNTVIRLRGRQPLGRRCFKLSERLQQMLQKHSPLVVVSEITSKAATTT